MPTFSDIASCSALETRQKWRLSHSCQLLLARPERAAAQVSALGIGFAVVYRRVVDLECRFVAAIVNIAGGFLNRVVARGVDAEEIHLGDAVGHPVDQYLGDAGRILDPDRDRVPQAAGQ
jgi:hypothetical protein